MGSRESSGARWGEYLGPFLAILTAVLAVSVVTGHVILAGRQQVDPLSTLLLNLLAVLFSSVCTIWVGRWSALRENKAFIRAALRTTHGLLEGLKVAEQAAVDGVARMTPRSSLAGEIQGAFWNEVVGRVVDHLRGLMRRAQETVANWQEFGPEEVDRLTNAEVQKEVAISELQAATEEVAAALRSLGSAVAPADTERLRARVEALEEERRRLESSSALAAPARGEARRLLAMGAMEEAIGAYSALIESGAGSHSNFMARARARYLAGDRKGALADLEKAREIDPSDPSIERLQDDIAKGRAVPAPSLTFRPSFSPAVYKANAALAGGDPTTARQCYEEARAAGLHPVFCAQNEAMVCLLEGDAAKARELLTGALPQTTGPFLRTQALALLALTDASDGTPVGENLARVAESVKALSERGSRFDVSQSPLQYLIAGLRRVSKLQVAHEAVIAVLVTGVTPAPGPGA